MNKLLTIAIPAYKKIVIDRLEMLIPQIVDEVELLIIDDNPSNNLKESIEERYGKIKNLKIIKNRINLGLGTNLANCFYYTDTKWMWLLGDDDIVRTNSVALILENIEDKDAILCKFSYEQQKPTGTEFTKYTHQKIVGIDNLIDRLYLQEREFNIGTLMFMSNSVYNVEKLKNNIDMSFKYTSVYAPHLTIIFDYLSKNKEEYIELLEDDIIINFFPEAEEKWTRFIVALGMLNFQYLILDIDVPRYKKLIKIFYKFINFRFIFLELFIEGYNINDYQKSKFIYKQLYENGLSKTDFFIEKILYKVLYFIMDKPFIVFKVFDILKKINSKYDVNLRVIAKGFNKKI